MLREMKRTHEAQYEEGDIALTPKQVEDITKTIDVGEPKTPRRFLDFGVDDKESTLSDEERQGTLNEFVLPLIARFRKLSPDTRAVFSIIVERGDGVAVPMNELCQVTGRGRGFLMGHIDTLDRYGFAHVEDDWDSREWVRVRNPDTFWPFWQELVAYAKGMGIPLAAFTDEMRFDLLD